MLMINLYCGLVGRNNFVVRSMLRYFSSKISKITFFRVSVSIILLILFIQIKIFTFDLKKNYPANNLIFSPNENVGSPVHSTIEPTQLVNMVGFERNKPTEGEIIFPKGNIRNNVEARAPLLLSKRPIELANLNVELTNFQKCMQRYQMEFDQNPVMANKTRQYPVPFSIFSNLNSQGMPIVTATFGGISINESLHNLNGIRISNYNGWLNNFTWKLQVVGNDKWFDCQLDKGICGKGHLQLLNIMVQCPINNGLLMENEENWGRVSFQVFDKSSAIVLDLRNLLVCNESPATHHVDLAACTMVSDDHFHRIPEWIEYHRLIGFRRFFVQIDSPNFDSYQIFFQKYIERHPNLVQLVPFYFESQRRPQDSARHDCLYRSKAFTKYLALFDVDEFFHFKSKQQSLIDFLDEKLSDTVIALKAPMYYFCHSLADTYSGSQTIRFHRQPRSQNLQKQVDEQQHMKPFEPNKLSFHSHW